MSANDIFNSIFGLIACAILIWAAIRSRKTHSLDDLK